ncbi:hypothetical protein QBC47DRAFT_412940 [Echria macrotheca]|uniref:Uncharacterized protein n=1 Tax=Echria macrotheca TaxID=438768 RepID=A0AAJ0FCE6_9PEZI|nr:hypothetical protein QBC47DRAFT_412940 [Echria macrotheca]
MSSSAAASTAPSFSVRPVHYSQYPALSEHHYPPYEEIVEHDFNMSPSAKASGSGSGSSRSNKGNKVSKKSHGKEKKSTEDKKGGSSKHTAVPDGQQQQAAWQQPESVQFLIQPSAKATIHNPLSPALVVKATLYETRDPAYLYVGVHLFHPNAPPEVDVASYMNAGYQSLTELPHYVESTSNFGVYGTPGFMTLYAAFRSLRVTVTGNWQIRAFVMDMQNGEMVCDTECEFFQTVEEEIPNRMPTAQEAHLLALVHDRPTN